MQLNSYSSMFSLFFAAILIIINSNLVFGNDDDYRNLDNDLNSIQSVTTSITESIKIDEKFSKENNSSINIFSPLINNNDINNTQSFNVRDLIKNQLLNEAISRVNQKVSTFSENVKSNIRAFYDESSHGVSQDIKEKLKESIVGFIKSLELSNECLMSFAHMKNGWMKGELWPIKFIDSMEFITSGIMDGVLSSFGEFDECLEIRSSPINDMVIYGQYCLAKVPVPFLHPVFNKNKQNDTKQEDTLKNKYSSKIFKMDNNLLKLMQAINLFNITYYRMGLCIPSTCNPKEIERAVNKILSPMKKQVIEIETECEIKDKTIELNAYQRIALSIFITLIILVVISTSLELYYNYKRKSFGRKKTIKKSLLIFSIISNTKRLFVNDNRRIKSIDTILWFFITLEFLGRSYIQPVFHNLIGLKRSNVGITKEYFTHKKFFWMRNNAYAMSIFILMSAISLAYNICGSKKKIKYNPLNYFGYLLNRYLSFTRRIIGPILLLYLLPLIGEGPIWHYFEQLHVKPCKQYLTQTLLYYSNYMDGFDKICNLPSATFSALFQLEIFAPLLLITLNFGLVGYVFLSVLVVIGCYLSIVQKLFFGLDIAPFEASTMNSVPEIRHSLLHYLGSTEQNISTFIIGLIFGYLIRKRPNLNTGGKLGNFILWIALLSLPPLASYWSESFKAVEGGFSQSSFIMWFLSGRVMWSLGYGWVVFACCTKRGGFLNRILSMNALQPLTRLSFGIYLNHIIIISYRLFNKKDTYTLSHSEIFENVFVDYTKAILISYFLYILIESPVYHLIKIVTGNKSKSVSRNNIVEEINGTSSRKLSENIEIKLFPQKP